MKSLCGDVPEPTSLKELLGFFSELRKDAGTVTNLQKRLDNDEEVKAALKSQRMVDVLKLVEYIDGFHAHLVMVPTDGNYIRQHFTNCGEDGIFYTFRRYLQKLYDTLLFLYWHVDMPWDVGLEIWQSESTTEPNNDLCKWLMGQYDSQLAALSVLKGGFNDKEVQTRLGSHLINNLGFMEREMPRLIAALFLLTPWEPPTVGDKVAFLRVFCKKMDEEDFKEQFGAEVKKTYDGANSEEIKAKSQKVLAQLTSAFGVIKDDGDVDDGLTPINDICYAKLSKKHLGEYVKLLLSIIPQLVTDMPKMITAMKTWKDNNTDADKSQSRFYYRFRGSVNNYKDKIEEVVGELTRENGSLHELLVALQGTKSTGIFSDGRPRKTSATEQSAYSAEGHANPSNVVGQSSDDGSQKISAATTGSAYVRSHITAGAAKEASTSTGNVVGGLLGAGAAVGVGGAAYASNLFGFGDLVRGAFSGGTPASGAGLRG